MALQWTGDVKCLRCATRTSGFLKLLCPTRHRANSGGLFINNDPRRSIGPRMHDADREIDLNA